jgi:carbon starvation protein
MLAVIFVGAGILFVLAYMWYGKFLDRHFMIDNQNPTPSHSDYDGVDRVPTKTPVLLGHHFSSIAGAGPVVGPIIAAVAFGWVPALIWIVIGSIFVGGVHDYSALVASIRHKARSVAEIANEYMTPLAYRLFLAFIWLTMIYILIVFVDLTATTFVSSPEVATSSTFFIILAIVFGFFLTKFKMPLGWGSLLFVPLIFAGIWIGYKIPITSEELPFLISGNIGRTWTVLLLVYAFFAAISPVWALLQPRDYLSSFLLYSCILASFIGILFGGFEINYPAFTTWSDIDRGTLFPILFITIACGACSGFHSIVASGTTSKQLNKETDVRKIGYGAMLIEGMVAIISLFAVAMVVKGDGLLGRPPLEVFGAGIGSFMTVIGIPVEYGHTFGVLAVSTFLLTTLDTGTRLARYIFEEFFNLKGQQSRYWATLATLVPPLIFTFITLYDTSGNPIPAWKAVWPVFGATNQLLAALALLVVFVWQRKKGKNVNFIAIPMGFMLVMTLWALVQLIYQSGFTAIGIISTFLLVLALILVFEAYKIIFLNKKMETASTNV